MSFFLLPFGVLGAATGVTLGVLHPWGGGKYPKGAKRDLHAAYPTLLMLDTTGIDKVAYRGIDISAAEEVSDQRAIFSRMAGRSDGILTGFPDAGQDGIMQGEFNFAHNETTDATGRWITVDQSVADEDTSAGFCRLLKIAEAAIMEGETEEGETEGVEMARDQSVTLEYMLRAVKEALDKEAH